jgi:hypothetical protein
MAELLIIFTLGYIMGGVTALVLLAFTLASRDGSTKRRRRRGRETTRDV